MTISECVLLFFLEKLLLMIEFNFMDGILSAFYFYVSQNMSPYWYFL